MMQRSLAILWSLTFISMPSWAQSPDHEALTRYHETVIHAHQTADIEAWMAVESDTVFASNNGVVRWLSRSDRQPGREAYLARTTFDVYRDLRPPIVTVSADGSLGWLLAEVEVKGWAARQDGAIEDFAVLYSWIEVYEKRNGVWHMTGTVSNSRALD